MKGKVSQQVLLKDGWSLIRGTAVFFLLLLFLSKVLHAYTEQILPRKNGRNTVLKQIWPAEVEVRELQLCEFDTQLGRYSEHVKKN